MSDYDLKSALNKMQEKRFNFLLLRGDKADQVLISPKPPKQKQISDLEPTCGPVKKTAKGVCFQESGTLVFGVKAEPAPSWEKTLIQIFKAQNCAKFLPLVVRQLRADESEEVETEEGEGGPEHEAPPSPEPPPADGERGTWMQLKARLSPLIGPAVAANPAIKAEVLGLLKKALDAEKAGSFGEATTAMQQIEPLLASKTPPSPTTPVSPVEPPPPDPHVLAETLKGLVPQIKQLIEADPGKKDSLLGLAGKVQALLKEGRAAEAKTALTQLESVVAPKSPGGISVMKLGKARIEWGNTRLKAVGDISKLRTAIFNEFRADVEQQQALQKALQTLDGLVENLHETLEKELDNVLNEADSDKRTMLAAQAKATMNGFVSFVTTNSIMKELDGNEVMPEIQITGPLTAKLAEIAQALG